jgi:hypothetical protein
LPHAEPLHQLLAVAARVERASPEGTSRFERDGLSQCPTLPKPQRREPVLTPTNKDRSSGTPCRRGPRFVAVGAGLEPAHASRREPRIRRGAIPFRSSYRLTKLSSLLKTSASEQQAVARCNRGGDDPIRTDGAFRGHSALAVRCLRPLGHVSVICWWGWRDLNSHARRRWFLRPVCLPFPPHPHDLITPSDLDTHQAIRLLSNNPPTKWWAPRDSNPEDVAALEAAASTYSARSPHK